MLHGAFVSAMSWGAPSSPCAPPAPPLYTGLNSQAFQEGATPNISLLPLLVTPM